MNRNAFSEQAQQYATYRPVYPDEMYDFILNYLEKRETAWDCGTGSGQVAGVLADHFETVYASDISPEQLSYAVLKPNIHYATLPAETTDYPSGFFDLITVAQAIHWFDFEAFYREVKRVAKKGAILAVIGYGRAESSPDVDPLIHQLYQYSFGRYFNEHRKYVEEQYQTIPFPFEELPSPGFTIKKRWTPGELEGYFNSWSSIQKIKTEEGTNPVEDVMKEIGKNVPADELLEVSFPVFLRLGRVIE